MEKGKIKKIVGLVLMVFVAFLMLSTDVLSASAATAWPRLGLGRPIKVYTISTGNNTSAYADASLTKRIGTIFARDEIWIDTIGPNRNGRMIAYCSYPVGNGRSRKYAVIPLNCVTYAVKPSEQGIALAAITAYRRAGGSQKAGAISKNDVVYKLAVSGSYTQVLYNIGSVSSPSGYRMAWVTTANYNRYVRKAGGTVSYNNTTKPGSSVTTLSYGLYHNNSARITCGFDGYTTTKGRHEGIDIHCYNGAPVYALTSGVVVRVAKGYNGSAGLSTIAIYNKATNKTVIYLHSAPVSSLYAGQNISKGSKIATEAWRGCSSSGMAHTHVEVRNGKQGYASKSVGDPVLNNPNPTSFWSSMGYTVK